MEYIITLVISYDRNLILFVYYFVCLFVTEEETVSRYQSCFRETVSSKLPISLKLDGNELVTQGFFLILLLTCLQQSRRNLGVGGDLPSDFGVNLILI